jgi:DMSO/TMAO reductase YedYZ molybdopterin-dependent catalytic subunit
VSNAASQAWQEHLQWSRRFFLGLGAAGVAALRNGWAHGAGEGPESCGLDPRLQAAIGKLERWLTPAEEFRDVSRGSPIPHTLAPEQLAEAGLTRDTWKLEILPDPEHPAKLRRPFSREANTALDFAGFLELGKTEAVRIPKVMTCLNIGCPLGMGVWEGVPLRSLVWKTEPRENLRRVIYWGFHNQVPEQRFQSSLPVDRVLEDPPGLPPVILAYKLNGDWLSPQRGGPVRMVVPEAYGFKSIKWLSTILLSNLFHANDTYAQGNNDVDSTLKTFAATLNLPSEPTANTPLALTGYAQVGTWGLSKVQVWIQPAEVEWPAEDRYFQTAPWRNAVILPLAATLADGSRGLLTSAHGFSSEGAPARWPLPLTKVHWAILWDGLAPGKYTLRCRTIDPQGHAQPLPRPFQKSGHAAIEEVTLTIRE